MGPYTNDRFVEELCELFELLSPTMDDYLYILDFRNDFYYIAERATERFKVAENGFHNVMKTFESFMHPDDLPRLLADIGELSATDRCDHDMVYRWLSVDGTPIWINCRGRVIRENGEALYMIGCINEVGTRQIADNISGLLGETGLQEFLSSYFEKTQTGYLLRFGVDDLKAINARLGVEYGDMILRKTAELISENTKPGQSLYRVLGDEFLVLDLIGGTEEEARSLFCNVRDAVERFVEENNYEAVFTISCGFVDCADVQDFSYTNVMKMTEFALDEAKRRGKNRRYSFSKEDYDGFLRKSALTLRLRQAVNHDFEGFEVYYQPIFQADGQQIYGAEALMRFHTEEWGMISPGEFIPILEETGLIIPAGRWILHEALKACKECQEYIPDFHINVNLSNIQIMKSNIGGELLQAVEEYGVKPSQVTIELTESRLLESDYRFTNIWNNSKNAGLGLALDDFGTGYSNFRYITELKPNVIKIDRTFTVRAVENEFEYELLSLFSKMAHDLKLQICVEGIETEEERQIICQLLPDYIQGFYFGRPCAYGDFKLKYL